MSDFTFTIFREHFETPEAQEVLKKLQAYQRMVFGMKITRGAKADAAPPEIEAKSAEAPAETVKKVTTTLAAKKITQKVAREAYVGVLSQFDAGSAEGKALAAATGGRILASLGAEKFSALDKKKYAEFVTICEAYRKDDESSPFNVSADAGTDDIDSMIE
jgi:hypothetical protein